MKAGPFNYDSIRLGSFDADELKLIKKDAGAKVLIKEGRITLEHFSHDKGAIWINKGDAQAYKIASEYII